MKKFPVLFLFCVFIAHFSLIYAIHPSPEKTSLAVYELTANDVSEGLAANLSGVLWDTVFQTGLFKMLSKEDMKRILGNQAEREKIQPECASDACIAEIASMLKVEEMVVGSIGKLGNIYVINLRLVNTEPPDTINIVSVTCKEENLVAKVNEAGIKLLRLKLYDIKSQSGQLHKAVRAGDLKWAKYLLEKGEDINARDENGETPLHLAVRFGHTAIVELFLKKGANVNAVDRDGKFPLHNSVCSSYMATILLEKGALINANDKRGWTPVYFSAWMGQQNTLELFLGNNALVNSKTDKSWTPLHLAAWKGYRDIVAFLLEKGAEINAKSKDNWTALHMAVWRGNKEIAELLVKAGAEINNLTIDGWTPLHTATIKGYSDIAIMLR